MNNQVVYTLYLHCSWSAASRCCASTSAASAAAKAIWDGGPGELSDAASALDWLQIVKPDAKSCWIAGVSFGTWIAMQLLMRRPEIDGFICVAPPANLYDFSFLAPCPSSGLMINGDKDRVVPSASVGELSAKLKTQRGIKIEHEVVPGANHFFENKTDDLNEVVGSYLDMRMVKDAEDRRQEQREGARSPA